MRRLTGEGCPAGKKFAKELRLPLRTPQLQYSGDVTCLIGEKLPGGDGLCRPLLLGDVLLPLGLSMTCRGIRQSRCHLWYLGQVARWFWGEGRHVGTVQC